MLDNADFGYYKITVERPLRLNFQASAERIARLENESGFKNLAVRQHEIELGQRRQAQIRELLRAFGAASGERLFKDRREFLVALGEADRAQAVRLRAPELKAVLAALGERDETAEICLDKDGNPEPDAELRDTENVPLSENVEIYFKREVLPHAPDAWIDPEKTKVGYEIPFNRHFYVFEPPRSLVEIDADLRQVTNRIKVIIEELAA